MGRIKTVDMRQRLQDRRAFLGTLPPAMMGAGLLRWSESLALAACQDRLRGLASSSARFKYHAYTL